MGCAVNFSGLSVPYACTDLSTGGLKKVYLADRAALEALGEVTVSASGDVTITSATGLKTSLVAASNDLLELQFNNKDGFSNFTDVKTVNADGSSTTVPTIQIEFLRMDTVKRAALEEIATPGAEIVAFIETAAGTYHMVGYDFGLYAASVDGATGVTRSEKNRYQLTLVGEENKLAYSLNTAAWDKVDA